MSRSRFKGITVSHTQARHIRMRAAILELV